MVQAKLLDIAVREFGSKGLDGASTRGIAAAAGTAMSSITYHYGGKDGLYLAAADHIAARMRDEMGSLADLDPAVGDAAVARAGVQRILARMTEKMAGEESADWALFLMREQMHPTEAFERIYGGVMGEVLRTLVELICAATGGRDRAAARVTAITLMGQVLVLRASRATCLKLLEARAIGDAELTMIKARIAANVDAILDRLTAEAQEQP